MTDKRKPKDETRMEESDLNNLSLHDLLFYSEGSLDCAKTLLTRIREGKIRSIDLKKCMSAFRYGTTRWVAYGATPKQAYTWSDLGLDQEERKKLNTQASIALGKVQVELFANHPIPQIINNIKKYAKEAGCDVEDLGITREQLESKIKSYYINEGQCCLRRAREHKNPRIRLEVLKGLWSSTESGKFTLAEIGTDEEDLEKIRVTAFQKLIKPIVRSINSDTNCAFWLARIDRIKKLVKEANLTLEDVGTSKEALEAIRELYHVRSGEKYLQIALDTRSDNRLWAMTRLSNKVASGEITFHDIGVDEDDESKFKKTYRKMVIAAWKHVLQLGWKRSQEFGGICADGMRGVQQSRINRENEGITLSDCEIREDYYQRLERNNILNAIIEPTLMSLESKREHGFPYLPHLSADEKVSIFSGIAASIIRLMKQHQFSWSELGTTKEKIERMIDDFRKKLIPCS